jgi:tetratricopeptide (TPR) repeat protein
VWQRHAQAALERLHEPDWLRAELESAVAQTALDRGDIAEALAANDRMMAAWARVAAREGVSLANAWLSSAEILLGARQADPAERAAHRAQEIARADSTPRPVFALQVRATLAAIGATRGRTDDAIATLRSVVPAIADAVDDDDVRVFTARSIFVGYLLTAGEFAEARAHLETQVATARAELPGGHLELARALAQLGHVEHTIGQREAGRAHLFEAVAIFESNPPALDSLIAYGSLAELAVNEGDHAAVVRWLERGDAVAQALLPADHPIRVEHEASLWAARASSTGDPSAFARVEALRARLSDARGAALDQVRAFAHRRHGDFLAAEVLDRAALAAAERSGRRRELANARFSLAESLAGLGRDPEEVARLFTAACAHFRDPATFEAHYAQACTARARP